MSLQYHNNLLDTPNKFGLVLETINALDTPVSEVIQARKYYAPYKQYKLILIKHFRRLK